MNLSEGIKHCINCRTELPADARFCDSCGTNQMAPVHSLIEEHTGQVPEEAIAEKVAHPKEAQKRTRLVSIASIACCVMALVAAFFTVMTLIVTPEAFYFALSSLEAFLASPLPSLVANILLLGPGYFLWKSKKYGAAFGAGLPVFAMILVSISIFPNIWAQSNFNLLLVFIVLYLPDIVVLLLAMAALRRITLSPTD